MDFKLKLPNDQTFPQVLATNAGPIIDEEVFPPDKVLDDDAIAAAEPFAGPFTMTTYRRGEDVSRAIYGARTALTVIVLSLIISLLVGVVRPGVRLSRWLAGPGAGAGDGRADAMPSLLAIVVSIVLVAGQSGTLGGILSASVAIMAVFVPQYFRVVRNATLAVKVEPFVDAARVTGASTTRSCCSATLSNVTSSLPVIITRNGAEAILQTLAGPWGFRLRHRADQGRRMGLRPEQGALGHLHGIVDCGVSRYRDPYWRCRA